MVKRRTERRFDIWYQVLIPVCMEIDRCLNPWMSPYCISIPFIHLPPSHPIPASVYQSTPPTPPTLPIHHKHVFLPPRHIHIAMHSIPNPQSQPPAQATTTTNHRHHLPPQSHVSIHTLCHHLESHNPPPPQATQATSTLNQHH